MKFTAEEQTAISNALLGRTVTSAMPELEVVVADIVKARIDHRPVWTSQNQHRIICSCGVVCDSLQGKSPTRIMGTTSDYYIAVHASSEFAKHLQEQA